MLDVDCARQTFEIGMMGSDLEEIMVRSGFENTMSILVAMRGPLELRFKGKWYRPLYLAYTIMAELIALTNFVTIGLRFLSPGIDVLERSFTGFPTTSISLSMFRVLYLFFRRARFAKLIAGYDLLYCHSEELQLEVEANAKILRFIPRLMVLLTALPMGPWCFMPILNALRGGKWVISVPSVWPFDPVASIYTFVFVSAMQTMSAGINTLRVVLFDNLFSVYACRQLVLVRQLSRELRRILSLVKMDSSGHSIYLDPGGERMNRSEASAYLRKELRAWAICHQESLRLARELQSLFSPCLTVQFSMICISCCTTAFVVVFSNADFLNLALCFLYAVGNSLELLITCIIGDLITYESDSLEKEVSGSHAYALEPDVVKVWLRLILTRARLPIRLSALGVYPLNTETFKNVMVTTYSFFTLLMSMKERQERET